MHFLGPHNMLFLPLALITAHGERITNSSYKQASSRRRRYFFSKSRIGISTLLLGKQMSGPSASTLAGGMDLLRGRTVCRTILQKDCTWHLVVMTSSDRNIFELDRNLSCKKDRISGFPCIPYHSCKQILYAPAADIEESLAQ